MTPPKDARRRLVDLLRQTRTPADATDTSGGVANTLDAQAARNQAAANTAASEGNPNLFQWADGTGSRLYWDDAHVAAREKSAKMADSAAQKRRMAAQTRNKK